MDRRAFLIAGAWVSTLAALPSPGRGRAADFRRALTDSNLVYLTPIKTDGGLSRCQAEVWYAMIGADLFVCTATDSWRSRAPRQGISRAKLWVGDLGQWRRADYKSLPSIYGAASLVSDQATIDKVLQRFGDKYASSWRTWGPIFRDGLTDGSRTLLRYRLDL